MKSLRTRAWLAVAVVAVIEGLLLFIPAGTIEYWQAWVYLAVFTAGSALTTLYLLKRDPALLERRMRGGPAAEKRPTQRVIMLFTSIGFISILVVPALDHRFGWSDVPPAIVIAGNVLVVMGYLLIVRVFRENTFTAATVQVAENQRVISTGPYAIVRHPMYAGGAMYLFGTPLALGSYWGFVPFAAMLPFLIWRLLDEERLLAKDLPGYTEYQQRVRYRLIPFVW
jgi:protein-S-isoprenylcysteine O-methyltransferase Ste14